MDSSFSSGSLSVIPAESISESVASVGRVKGPVVVAILMLISMALCLSHGTTRCDAEGLRRSSCCITHTGV